VQRLGNDGGIRGGAGGGDDDLARAGSRDGLDLGPVPGGADVLQFSDAAQPAELLRVVARARVAEQRVHGRAIGEGGDGRAVLVGRAVERAGGGKPGRGRHVRGDDGG